MRLKKQIGLIYTAALRCVLAFYALQLAACAVTPAWINSEQPQWRGRLSLSVNSEPKQHFHADFLLVGSAVQGELNLYTPFGNKAAQITWDKNFAKVEDGRSSQQFANLSAATQALSGANIPVAELFNWLQGKQNQTLANDSNWRADLSRIAQGQLWAIRLEPLPQLELRVILEP